MGRITTTFTNLICLLFANFYLHYHKVNEKNLDWIEFTTKVNYKFSLENRISGIL